jgi:hypothetical protein
LSAVALPSSICCVAFDAFLLILVIFHSHQTIFRLTLPNLFSIVKTDFHLI